MNPQDSLQKKASLALTSSNVSIAKQTIKQTVIPIFTGIIILTKSSIVENNRKFMKVEYSNITILSFLDVDFFFFYFLFLFNLYVVCL